MSVRLLLGDEAAAQAAIDAGIAGAFSYPGTPSTEIFEYIRQESKRNGNISAEWSPNEKVAYEEALGMSYAGLRSIVSMKHVGLNVAADPFINSAITGVNAGIVLVVADDPGMHSSQNEQDSRFYGEFAQIPVFEPSNQQEAYDTILAAFEYSEQIRLPAMVRMVTRLCHSRANVIMLDDDERSGGEEVRKPLPNPNDWTLVPAIARRKFRGLVDAQKKLTVDSQTSNFNDLTLAGPRGVIACGVAYNYLLEANSGPGELSILKIGHYPLPITRIRELIDHCEDILVAEDGYPLVERRLTGILGIPGKRIRGKLSGHIPPTGELTPDILAEAIGRQKSSSFQPMDNLAGRPPQLCRGCPHIDSFKAIVEATSTDDDPLLFSDIGCYTLGVMPPYRAVHACVDMGASISMAHGAAKAGHRPVVCTIGDSTFAHSGMTGILGAAAADADMTVVILDNSTTAMTGAQDSFTSGERLLEVLRGLGVKDEHLHVIEPHPKEHAENVELLRREIAHRGLSVIVARRACIHLKSARPKADSETTAGART